MVCVLLSSVIAPRFHAGFGGKSTTMTQAKLDEGVRLTAAREHLNKKISYLEQAADKDGKQLAFYGFIGMHDKNDYEILPMDIVQELLDRALLERQQLDEKFQNL